jgi:hypothetical protein
MAGYSPPRDHTTPPFHWQTFAPPLRKTSSGQVASEVKK